MTCYPDLLYNFIYKVPTSADILFKGIPGLIYGVRFFFSRDLTIAEVGLPALAFFPDV
jgi:hypothetical protein